MHPDNFCQLAARLLKHPTAPYHEHAVRAEAEQICREHDLEFERDRFGNLLVRLQTDPKQRPLVLAAHLDHPGFHIVKQLSPKRWLAAFRGGVSNDYFHPGTPVRLMPGAVPAKLGRRGDKERTFELETLHSPAESPRYGVWELEDFTIRQGHIHARACDDLIGVASILATLIDLKGSRARVNVLGVLSRAEEVGFHGALTIGASGILPSNALIVSLETSRELPGVKMGAGVILRVGDRASIFDSLGTRFLGEVATGIQAKDPGFHFQRALMSGGTCEATAYQEFGYEAIAVCVALGNYHNCAERNQIKAEYVSIDDACGMVRLLVSAARALPRYDSLIKRLPKRLEKLLREAWKNLPRTA